MPDLRDVLTRPPDVQTRPPDVQTLAVCVATGDDRLYANVLLTVGYISPPA
jgi:hypothetical protein